MIISNRTKYLFFITPVLLLSLANAEEDSWTKVDGGTWNPSGKILSTIKIHLEPYMKSQEKVFGSSLQKWDNYRFQYQGQEDKGRKFIYINAFCYFHKGINLSKTFVFVLDGGGCFFQLKYDPVADKFFGAFINGEA